MPEPEYEILGGDITIKFTALESAKIPELKLSDIQKAVLREAVEKALEAKLRKALSERVGEV